MSRDRLSYRIDWINVGTKSTRVRSSEVYAAHIVRNLVTKRDFMLNSTNNSSEYRL